MSFNDDSVDKRHRKENEDKTSIVRSQFYWFLGILALEQYLLRKLAINFKFIIGTYGLLYLQKLACLYAKVF